jgi:transcriptional regulator with XRE-family HTH domain
MHELSSRIRQSRRRAGLSQAALAQEIGVNRSAVAQWERRSGASRPTTANMSRISVITGVPFEWLATGRGPLTSQAGMSGSDPPALLLNFFAHDEVEERILLGLRKLEYWQTLSIAELVESLGSRRLERPEKRRTPASTA